MAISGINSYYPQYQNRTNVKKSTGATIFEWKRLSTFMLGFLSL